jgi:hypothetical protein
MYIKSIREQSKRAERQYPAIPNLAAAGASLLCRKLKEASALRLNKVQHARESFIA